MRKILAISLIVSGTIFSIFIFNLIMYATVPAYRSLLVGSVHSDADIPVVGAGVGINDDFSFEVEKENDFVPMNSSKESIEAMIMEIDASYDVPLADAVENTAPAEPQKQIIDKEYHEDCGTGKGYWVITYEDGSTEIE